MPQPPVLTEKVGNYLVTATETGYRIVTEDGKPVVTQEDKTVHQSKTEGDFISPVTHCARTNMQRAMLIAQQLMEDDAKKDS